MKITFLFCLVCFSSQSIHAQDRKVIASAGRESNNGLTGLSQYFMTYTVGGPVKKKRNIDELMKMKLVCATGKPDITEQSKLVVKEIAQVLKEEPTWTITIEGHTDNVGDANANLMLSKKRSESVRNLLISFGIEASRIKAGYFGELQPIADNATPEGRNKNRRIDFKFVTD